MKLVGAGNQSSYHHSYVADGAIATGGTAQLILGQSLSRSTLFIQNLSSGTLMVEIGCGVGTAVLTNGVVTSVTIVNSGFNFTKPPTVRFMGGGQPVMVSGKGPNVVNSSYVGLSQPNGPTPNNHARGFATLSGGSISGVTITNGGSGYKLPPYVLFQASDLDPNGVSTPSATVGILLSANGGSVTYNATFCPTDAVSIWGATTGQVFTCRWSD